MSIIVSFFKKSFWNFHLRKYVFVIRFRKLFAKSEKFQDSRSQMFLKIAI